MEEAIGAQVLLLPPGPPGVTSEVGDAPTLP